MDKMPKIIMICINIILVFSLIGCATIVKGKFQKITVTSDPSQAFVTVDGQQTKTPGVVTLDTTRSMYVLRFEKEGYEPVEVKIKRGLSGWLFGNIIFGGIIGIVIDFASNSAYKLSPEEVEAALKPLKVSLNRIEGDAIVYIDKELLLSKVKE